MLQNALCRASDHAGQLWAGFANRRSRCPGEHLGTTRSALRRITRMSPHRPLSRACHTDQRECPVLRPGVKGYNFCRYGRSRVWAASAFHEGPSQAASSGEGVEAQELGRRAVPCRPSSQCIVVESDPHGRSVLSGLLGESRGGDNGSDVCPVHCMAGPAELLQSWPSDGVPGDVPFGLEYHPAAIRSDGQYVCA